MFSLSEELRSFVGAPPVASYRAPHPVNEPMVDHWRRAFSDEHPLPPALLGSWTLDAVARRDGGPRDQVLRRLEEAGYPAVVATQYEQTYHRPLRVGDHLSESLSVEDVSEEKQTALGPGYFVTVLHTYRDDAGELVGTARMRLLKFRPKERTGRRPTPAVNADTAFFWEGVAESELRIQRCADCAALRHPPRPMCGECRSTKWDWIVASGRGTVHSHAVHHHPPLPGVELPHAVVLVDLDEGVRMISHLTPDTRDEVRIGLPVEVVFTRIHDDLVLPLFRPRDEP